MESYAAGETQPPLIEETIGANFERTVASYGENEALVEFASGRRWTYTELDRDVDALARGLMGAGIEKGDRVGVWAPNCAEWTIAQYASAKVGAILVNVNPSYRTHEFSYAVNQSGLRMLISAESFKTSDYRAMVEEVWDRVSRGSTDGGTLERVVYIGTDDWDALIAEGEGLPEGALAERMATLEPGDPINIQYTSGTTGYPKGATLSHRNILNNGFFVTETINFTDRGPAVHPGALLPLLRDGDGQPRLHHPRRHDGDPGCRLRPGDHPASGGRRSAAPRCTACPTMFIAMQNHPTFADHDLSTLRTGCMAGSICPVEVMKHCINDMHMAEVSIAYGMTETSPVSTQTRADDDLDRRTATIGRVHPHVEIKVVDPATGETVERGRAGRALHPRLLGDARLLGRAGEDRRGHRLRRLDAHRRPRRDARGRLLQHRRPDQGHGDPGRGEHLPARDRGVPLHPPRHRGRAGDRRARRAVRRGARRLGQAAPRGRPARRREGARVRDRASWPTTRSRATCCWSTSSR